MALELAGVTASTGDPADGRIEREPDGAPSGTLQEGAMGLVERVVPRPGTEEQVAGIVEGQRYLHSLGITGWQEAIVGGYAVIPDCFDAYLEADRRGQLTARVVGALWWQRGLGVGQLDGLTERRERAGSAGRFRCGTVKIMEDGVCENFTASMLTPYLDRHGDAANGYGSSFFDAEELKESVAAIDARGFQVHFRAIGDRAIREALEALAARCSRSEWARSASTASCGSASVRLDFSVFTSPRARTERHTWTLDGTGEAASGSPSKSTEDHSKALIQRVVRPSDDRGWSRRDALPYTPDPPPPNWTYGEP